MDPQRMLFPVAGVVVGGAASLSPWALSFWSAECQVAMKRQIFEEAQRQCGPDLLFTSVLMIGAGVLGIVVAVAWKEIAQGLWESLQGKKQ